MQNFKSIGTKKSWKVPSAPKKKGKGKSGGKKDYDAKKQEKQQKVHKRKGTKNKIQAGITVEETHSFLNSTIAKTIMGNHKKSTTFSTV